MQQAMLVQIAQARKHSAGNRQRFDDAQAPRGQDRLEGLAGRYVAKSKGGNFASLEKWL
jgi:hypothetical protein